MVPPAERTNSVKRRKALADECNRLANEREAAPISIDGLQAGDGGDASGFAGTAVGRADWGPVGHAQGARGPRDGRG